jgi:hypothetical protein
LTNKTFPILNTDDKKISDTFECQNPASLWGGFASLCLGIAVAALVVATVATGGLALAAVSVGVAACGCGIVGSGIGMYKTLTDCDAILNSQWKLYHNTVKIEKANALLNLSILPCPNGGMVTIIMNPAIAIAAAQQISANNMAGIDQQLKSEFVIGFIGTITAATDPVSMSTSALAMPFYFFGEQKHHDNEYIDTGSETIVTTAAGAAITNPEVYKQSGIFVKESAIYAAGRVSGNVAWELPGAVGTVVSGKMLKGTLGKMGPGLIGAGINCAITMISDDIEKGYYEAARSEYEKSIVDDKAEVNKGNAGGMKIIATTQG